MHTPTEFLAYPVLFTSAQLQHLEHGVNSLLEIQDCPLRPETPKLRSWDTFIWRQIQQWSTCCRHHLMPLFHLVIPPEEFLAAVDDHWRYHSRSRNPMDMNRRRTSLPDGLRRRPKGGRTLALFELSRFPQCPAVVQ